MVYAVSYAYSMISIPAIVMTAWTARFKRLPLHLLLAFSALMTSSVISMRGFT